MWKFNPFGHKEQQNGLEGRVIDIGNFKIQVRNAIAEGGFSSVYLARDAIHGSKQFALKHMICNDEESLELVMKEISVMKMLKGHPNVVTLHAHAILDMGRTKEALLLMEYCEKSLVDVLESRGAGFFEEKQVVTIFRDVCNAVFAMHCQSPPIAHRDLKAENLLLGSDGLWKLCDFGSTSTNHKRFEKPEEMGIEEDNIRKHTTPAYRAPEMWDLFRRDLISEKVDIWALGCLLFRICFFKSAFDGESKLQVLNGNYRIPDLPKYSTSLTDLIRDMLQSSPDDRPDITQVWFRVNGLLPDGLLKSLPDRPHDMLQHGDDPAGMSKSASKNSPMPRRSPPPPPSSEAPRNATSESNNLKMGDIANPLGAFWTTQHAKDSEIREHKTGPKYDEEISSHKSAVNEKHHSERPSPSYITPKNDQNSHKNSQVRSVNRPSNPSSKDSPISLFPDNSSHGSGRFKQPIPDVKPAFQDDSFTAFVADFDSNKQSPGTTHQNPQTEPSLKADVEKLKEQLARVSSEKADVTSKYEKLTSICKTQRQEIQDLKQALAARTPSPSKDSSKKNVASPANQSSTPPQNEKIEGTVWELQEGFFERGSPSPDSQQWQAFPDDPKRQTALTTNNTPRSVRTKSIQASATKQPLDNNSNWGFETESFKVAPNNTSSKVSSVQAGSLSGSRRFGEAKTLETKVETQPAGWAGF